jgi:hypothetical protein
VFVEFLRKRGHFMVVILQRLGFLPFETAVYEQDDQDQQHHADARGDAATDHQRVLVKGQRAARALGAAGFRALRLARRPS